MTVIAAAPPSRPIPVERAHSLFRWNALLAALHEAIRLLEESEAAADIFGANVVAHYLNAARVEQETYDAVVHPWDRERYLERG